MTLEGTIVNGHVRLDTPCDLPEGTRVRLLTDEEHDDDAAWDAMPPPPVTETREEFLQSLRESIAESEAGDRGRPAREVMKELAIKHGLRLLPGE